MNRLTLTTVALLVALLLMAARANTGIVILTVPLGGTVIIECAEGVAVGGPYGNGASYTCVRKGP